MSDALSNTLRHNLRQALDKGRVKEAGDILARLKAEDPLSKETRGMELEYLLRAECGAEASALAAQLCRLFPGSGRILFLAGKVSYRRKDYRDAEARFRESHRVHPHWQTEYWLGKTLTQLGEFAEAEALLNAAADRLDVALLDLAWLHERRGDAEAALRSCESYLKKHPGQEYASRQRSRLKARLLEPDALIEELGMLAELGEAIPEPLFPEFVQRLFETGQSPRAREEIAVRMAGMSARLATSVAWICYRAQSYDLAADLFLAHLPENLSNHKYLNALEAAAGRSNRLAKVAEVYQSLTAQAPQLHGRCRSLARRFNRARNPRQQS